MSRESTVQREIWLDVGGNGKTRLFRVNTGKAWLSGAGPAQRLVNGDVLVPAGRPVALGFGLTNGDPVVGVADLIGFTVVEITPNMVGHKVAVLTSIETKRTKGGVTREKQEEWRKLVRNAGGIAGIANSVESARAIFDGWFAQFEAP